MPESAPCQAQPTKSSPVENRKGVHSLRSKLFQWTCRRASPRQPEGLGKFLAMDYVDDAQQQLEGADRHECVEPREKKPISRSGVQRKISRLRGGKA